VSKRIAKFRSDIIRQIPRFPNNRESKEFLEKQPLTGLLVHYINWRFRFVACRPRTIHIEPSATTDPRWKELKPEIKTFLEKVEHGDDLSPHLSDKTRTRGFTLAAHSQGPDVDRWADKDFLLNVMGYYHFHLGSTVGKRGFVNCTNDELFATVSRECFTVIGIFDHSVFHSKGTNAMTAERERLWNLFMAHGARGNPPGSAMLLSGISTSGHTTQAVFMAQDYTKIIEQWDPRLDDPAFVAQALIAPAGESLPTKLKLSWRLTHLDLGIYDEASNTLFRFRDGPN